MKKALKIAAIAVVSIVALVFVVSFVSRAFPRVGKLSAESNLGSPTGLSMGIQGAPSSMRSKNIADSAVEAPFSADTYEEGSSGVAQLPSIEKKIIKNGDLRLKVDSADDAVQKVADIAKGNGGEVFASNFYQSANNVKNGTVTVKVPVANFEKTFSELKKVGSLVLHESISGQDVTEQYVDLQAQLKNAQAEEQSFVRILDQAQKIDDVLAVTRELSRVRGTIEQLQGRVRYMESQTDMSVISIDLTENQSVAAVDAWRPYQVVKDSLTNLVRGLQGFVDFLIRFFIVLLPFLAIWGLLIWLAYIVGKKVYLKFKDNSKIE